MVQTVCMRWFMLVSPIVLNMGCSLIPIQAGRVDAVLDYTQTYELGDIRRIDPTGQCLGPRLMTAVIGDENYCNISDANRDRYLRSLFLQRSRWTVNGLVGAIISPSPWWSDGFTVSANGRYLVRDDKTLIATSDFYIAKQSVHDIKELFSGCKAECGHEDQDLRWVDLLIRQIVVPEVDLNEPGRPDTKEPGKRFVNESELVVRLYVLPLDSTGVFAIAPVRHEVGIVSQVDAGSVYSVACLEFDEPQDGRRIFDVRKRDSLLRTNDYADLLRRAGIHQEDDSFHPKWHGQSCAAQERRIPYQASSRRSASEWSSDPDGERFKYLFEEPSCPTPPPRCHSDPV